jgi:two-component system copper resistance phosphate regulon response regulator CusR
MLKIGIAEDDPRIAELLKSALEESDNQVLTVANGIDALDLFLDQSFDLFIIDVMMPGLNGIQLCKHVRQNAVQTPILMLTAMGTIDDKVTGLEAGADDYLVKPFHLKELFGKSGRTFTETVCRYSSNRSQIIFRRPITRYLQQRS